MLLTIVLQMHFVVFMTLFNISVLMPPLLLLFLTIVLQMPLVVCTTFADCARGRRPAPGALPAGRYHAGRPPAERTTNKLRRSMAAA